MNGDVEERTAIRTTDDTCAVRCGMNVNLSLCQPLSQTVWVHLHKENSQGTLTLTTWKRGLQKQTSSSCASVHSVHESLFDVLVNFHMFQFIAHVVVLVALSVLRVTNSIVVNAPNLFTF